MAFLVNSLVMSALPVHGVTLAWDPSPSPSIAGYYLYSGNSSSNYTDKLFVGNNTSVVLTNLVAGNTYYFAVTSYNSAGIESLPSNQAIYTVPTTTTVPPMALGSPKMAAGSFSFTVSGEAGTSLAVEASDDLIHWVRVVTNTAPFTFVDNNASQFTKRFYRTAIPTNPVSPNVVTQPLVLGSPKMTAGSFSFSVPGVTNAQYAVEVSVNLTTWTRVATNTAPFTFVDSNASQFTKRFYRTFKL